MAYWADKFGAEEGKTYGELLNEDYEAQQELKRQAVEDAKNVAKVAGEAPAALEKATEQGRKAVLYQAAQAQAAQAGMAGGTQSGANVAGLSQIAKDRGVAAGTLEAQSAKEIAQAKLTGAQAQYEVTKAEKEMGTPMEERLKKTDYYNGRINSILKKYKGVTSASSDYQEAAREIRRLAETEPDPYMQQWLREMSHSYNTKKLKF